MTAAVVSPTVIPAATVEATTATVEPATTPAVETALSATAATVSAAVLGKRGCANQSDGSGRGEKRLYQGGFPHFVPST